LPVLFYIFGGAYQLGSGREAILYDGRYHTLTYDVIIVTFNYRLGALGFLVAETDKGLVSGNFGVKDALQALDWVHKNIHQFGGDPKRITIYGMSAGATTVQIMLTTPVLKKGAFSRAIIESAPTGMNSHSIQEMQSWGLQWAKNMSCTATKDSKVVADLDCLLKLDSKTVIKTTQYGGDHDVHPVSEPDWWWSHVDGKILPEPLFKRLLEGKFKNVPVLIGNNRDEFSPSFRTAQIPIVSRLDGARDIFEYDNALAMYKHGFGKNYKRVLEEYPLSKTSTVRNEDSIVQWETDYLFVCSSNSFIDKMAHKGMAVYKYWYTQVSSVFLIGRCTRNKVCHSSELPIFWRPFWAPLKAREKKLSDQMIAYFIGFVQGNINKHTKLPWKRYTLKQKNYIELGDKVKALRGNREKQCRIWDHVLGYKF